METPAQTSTETKDTQGTPAAEKMGYIAVVEFHQGPDQQQGHQVEFIHAPSKLELRKKLRDPMVKTLWGTLRGRMIPHTVSRDVQL